MADPHNLPPRVGPSYYQSFRANDDFRLDEGYSEETISRAGSDMPLDSNDALLVHSPPEPLLPAWIGNLSESERSGRCHPSILNLI